MLAPTGLVALGELLNAGLNDGPLAGVEVTVGVAEGDQGIEQRLQLAFRVGFGGHWREGSCARAGSCTGLHH